MDEDDLDAKLDEKNVATEDWVKNEINKAQLEGGDGSGPDLSIYATKTELNNKADKNHTHDDRYYTEAEIDAKLASLDIDHDHDEYITQGDLSDYVTDSELDLALLGKADKNHIHSNYASTNHTHDGYAAKRDTVLDTTLSMGRKGNTVVGSNSTALGSDVTASGFSSHAEGGYTTASGCHSHAEGFYTIASGDDSHAEGYYTIASGFCQHVQGCHNIEDINSKYLHIVGNGGGANLRSNAHTLDWDGNAWYAGKVTAGANPTKDMDLATKNYVDAKFNDAGIDTNHNHDTLYSKLDHTHSNYATISSLSNYATISSLNNYTTKTYVDSAIPTKVSVFENDAKYLAEVDLTPINEILKAINNGTTPSN